MNTSTIHAFKYNDCNKIRTKQTECYDDRLSSKKKGSWNRGHGKKKLDFSSTTLSLNLAKYYPVFLKRIGNAFAATWTLKKLISQERALTKFFIVMKTIFRNEITNFFFYRRLRDKTCNISERFHNCVDECWNYVRKSQTLDYKTPCIVWWNWFEYFLWTLQGVPVSVFRSFSTLDHN